jgi:hypothetical protein
MMLNILGTQLNLSAVVDSVPSKWHHHFCHSWSNFASLTILSFQDNAGKQVNDTSTTANSAALLPVQDGQVSDCHKKQIWFVRIQLNLSFVSLVTLEPPGITALHVEYYIELPQGHRDLVDGHWQQYHLTTFLRPDNICLMPPQEFSCAILGITLQDGPIDLLCPNFNLTSAKTDSTTIKADISLIIIKLATPSVLDHLYNQLQACTTTGPPTGDAPGSHSCRDGVYQHQDHHQ